jgi:hypothetical protein
MDMSKVHSEINPNTDFDEFREMLMTELRQISDWTIDQQMNTKNLFKDRERIIQLNLKLNEL